MGRQRSCSQRYGWDVNMKDKRYRKSGDSLQREQRKYATQRWAYQRVQMSRYTMKPISSVSHLEEPEIVAVVESSL